jgi:uncharacterized integral membrane protein
MRMSEKRILRIIYVSKTKRSDWWIKKIKSSFVLLCVIIVFLQRNSPTVSLSLSHTHTHTHPVGLLWTTDHLVAKAALPTQHTAKTSDEHSCTHWGSKQHS